MQDFGRLLLGFGLFIALVGCLFMFFGRIPGFGQLPGDFYYESDNVRIYFPLATCLILSIVLSLVFYVLRLIT
jgi:hypothetical protein